jgi:hypothetical protein
MVNFRVRNLDAMAAQLRSAGIALEMDTQVYPNGHFARLHDPESPIQEGMSSEKRLSMVDRTEKSSA